MGKLIHVAVFVILSLLRSRWKKRQGKAEDGIWLCDPNAYSVVLATPSGSADGNWKP